MESVEFEKIQKEIESDITLSRENISSKMYLIPNFHSKILRFYYQESTLLEKMEAELSRLYIKIYKHYTSEVDYIVKPAQANLFIYGDEKYSRAKLQVNKQKIQVDWLEKTIKKVSQLSFDVKNIIEWEKFQVGEY